MANGIKGIGASFQIEDGASPSTMTDVSAYLNRIDSTSDVDRLDDTTFQPNVANPLKSEVPGHRTRGFTLSGIWSAAAEAFFSALEGALNQNYIYSPDGTTSGKKKITGTCNVLNYSGPQSDVNGITTFSVDIAVTSRTVGEW